MVKTIIRCQLYFPSNQVAERNRRRRKLLVTTNTEEKAIAAPAIIGFNSPAIANGIAATL